jgi:hypothetical protein
MTMRDTGRRQWYWESFRKCRLDPAKFLLKFSLKIRKIGSGMLGFSQRFVGPIGLFLVFQIASSIGRFSRFHLTQLTPTTWHS